MASAEDQLGRLWQQGASAEPRPGDRPVALSEGQRGLWIQDRMGGGAAYSVPFAYRMTGPLDPEALCAAIVTTAARHEAFRLRIVAPHGEPMGLIASSPLSVTRGSAPSDSVAARLEPFWHEPFDLGSGALLRSVLLRIEDEDEAWVLSFTAHHLVFDDWSMQLFLSEVSERYRSPEKSVEGPLPGGLVGAASSLTVEEREVQLRRWEELMVDAPAQLDLPRVRRDASTDTVVAEGRPAGEAALTLDAGTTRALRSLARSAGCSDFVLHLAAWKALVAAYSGQEDIVVGTPIAHREEPGAEDAVGYFLSTLLVRTAMRPGLTFAEALVATRDSFFESLELGSVSYEEIARRLATGERGGSPLFSVWFASDDGDEEPLRLDGVRVERIEVPSRLAKFELALFCSFSEAGTSLALEFDAATFLPETAHGMLRHYAALLRAVAEDPGRRLGEIELMDREERERLERWGAGPGGGEPRHLVEAFDAAVATAGDDPAIDHAGRITSYRGLAARSADYAAFLAGRGVRRGSRVGLALDRSAEMIAAVLGVLRLGAAYVPLSPDHPDERLAHVVTGTAMSLLLCEADEQVRLGSLGVPTATPADVAQAGTEPLLSVVDAQALSTEDVAYVTYTSGSTGEPKGILMSHRAAWNLMGWQNAEYAGSAGIGRGARTLQFAALAFDVSLQEIFGALTTGGVLVMIDREERDAVHDLMRLLGERDVHRAFMPAPVLLEAAEAAKARGVVPSSLRVIVAGSEQLVVSEALRYLFGRLPEARLHNEYGPSETHVATRYEVPDDPATWAGWTPIGRPVGHTGIRLLDQLGRRVPVGSVGEVFISGPGLADGYAGKPAVTAAAFVPDPFSATPGARMYRSGDLARYLPSGELEFLGRRDTQVKIRGFRVELEEVSAALERTGLVSGSFVRSGEVRGEPALIAYWTPSSAQAGRDEIFARLAESLPAYMTPSALIELERFPLTPNGKVDQRRLPEPGPDDLAGAASAPGPVSSSADPVIDAVAKAMARVLGLPGLAPEADFFSAGGHSLTANRLVWVLDAEHGIGVTLRSVMEGRTPTRIARAGVLHLDRSAAHHRVTEPVHDKAAAAATLNALMEEMGEPG